MTSICDGVSDASAAPVRLCCQSGAVGTVSNEAIQSILVRTYLSVEHHTACTWFELDSSNMYTADCQSKAMNQMLGVVQMHMSSSRCLDLSSPIPPDAEQSEGMLQISHLVPHQSGPGDESGALGNARRRTPLRYRHGRTVQMPGVDLCH